jgi:hypothetical protein
MGTEEQAVLLDTSEVEQSFNASLEKLRKSLGNSEEDGGDSGEELNKARKLPPSFKANAEKKKKAAAEEDEEDSEEDDNSEEEDEEMGKSIQEILSEDPEAAAAMDVEPFLLQLAKAFDESMGAIAGRITKLETLTKSIGEMNLASAELQKSTNALVKSIGDMPVPRRAITSLSKSRFTPINGDNPAEYPSRDVLIKSRDWLKTGKIDINEAGMIEGRINKNVLGRTNDRLDQKVAALMREDK